MSGERIAVTGANGMLGPDVVAALRAAGHEVRPLCWPEWDITRPRDRADVVAGLTAIVNCCAYTKVDDAEKERDAAYAINATGVGELARRAATLGVYMLHISTDFVYDGTKAGAYTESDPPHPLNVYGASKLAGEELLRACGGEHCVIRTEWTYGMGGQSFVHRLLARAATTPRILMVNDQFGAPTWTRDLAAAITRAVEQRLPGLYLYAAAGHASRYEIADFILRRRKLATLLEPCRTSDMPAPARRPLNSRFDCRSIEAALHLTRRPWDSALAEFLEQLP